jgi:hypothetical protein
MTRFCSVLAVSLVLLATVACSSTKPPAPGAVQGNKIIAALKDLSGMYEKKNLPGFMNLISAQYKERQAFSSSIASVFLKYDSVQFSIQYSKMFITVEERGMTRATFNWESGWESPAAGILKNSGRITFVFNPTDATLVSIEGKNPFIPQTVESSGK